MRNRPAVRVAILAISGLALAGGLGYAAHLAAGDEVGLSAVGIEAGDRLAPPEAAVTSDGSPGTTSPDTGAGRPETTTQAPTGTDKTGEPRPQGETAVTAGRTVFSSAGCGSCHILAAAGAAGTAGPNLDELVLTRAQVEAQVRTGGGGMPSFAGTLSEGQIRDVAAYVVTSTRRAATAPSGSETRPTTTIDDDRGGNDDRGGDDSSRGRGGDDDGGGDDHSGRGRGDDRDD